MITLHAIILHPHSDELTEEKHHELHEKSNSFIGFIRLVFHENDDERLDNLIFTQDTGSIKKKIDSKHKYPNSSIFNNTTSIAVKITAIKIVKWNTHNFNKLHFVNLNGLRGPPLLT
ncbi:hypothetical protein N9K49_00435 [Flavobacteriaceae bacterium]|nr:hypothetical protein [Flavobacteriaceae bacterium]